MLGFCDLRHQIPRQSRRTLAWPREPGFTNQNEILCVFVPWWHFDRFCGLGNTIIISVEVKQWAI
jgi:hypothetical protein